MVRQVVQIASVGGQGSCGQHIHAEGYAEVLPAMIYVTTRARDERFRESDIFASSSASWPPASPPVWSVAMALRWMPALSRPMLTANEPARKISRNIHEHARDVARSLGGSEAFEQSRRDRNCIEMWVAHLKRILRLDRRLVCARGAQDEFTLATIAQNLRRLAKLVAQFAPSALA